MNRAQRRKAAKQANHAGRVTPKKKPVPRAFATVTDGAGNTKRVEIQGEEISAEEMRFLQEQEAQQKAAQAALHIRARGFLLPGDW